MNLECYDRKCDKSKTTSDFSDSDLFQTKQYNGRLSIESSLLPSNNTPANCSLKPCLDKYFACFMVCLFVSDKRQNG